MENITSEQERQLREYLKDYDQKKLEAEGSSIEVQAAPKDVFCENWPSVREVLGYLKQLPGVPSAPTDAVIKIGDLAHQVIC